jgi:predicted CoA-binding protein
MDEKRREAIRQALENAQRVSLRYDDISAAFEQALRDAGYTVVPVKPTEAMLAAGAPWRRRGGLKALYRAMVQKAE